MKTIKILLFLFLSLGLFSCGDDDKAPAFNTDFIKQVEWSGTLVKVEGGKEVGNYGVKILFATDSRGTYEYTSGLYNFNKDFQYILDNKLIVIGGNLDTNMTGDWILIDIKTNRMTLRKGLTSNDNYSTLELTKMTGTRSKPSRR